MEYTAVIRTLGKAGEKYQRMLDSLKEQTIKPKDIIVYIAEGYDIPIETIGIERYVYVKKGMVAQRALQYNEVQTEYMLFLDDDLYLPPYFVQRMFSVLMENNANVVSPDIYPNDKRVVKQELLMTISGRMRARRGDDVWGYKVMRTAGYSYNKNPYKDVYLSQTNAGACFFCKKTDFLKIHFEEELWLDKMSYAIGDDQLMYYKMHLLGLKQLTLYHSGIEHLDGGSNIGNKDKEHRLIYSDFWFKTVFWHRFIYKPEKNVFVKFYAFLCIAYALLFTLLISLLKLEFTLLNIKRNAIKEAMSFLKSESYYRLPNISKII